MYCNRCGKEIDYENNLCLECTAELAVAARQAREEKKAASSESAIANSVPVSSPVTVAPLLDNQSVAEPNTRLAGLGKGIAANIIAIIVAFCVGVQGALWMLEFETMAISPLIMLAGAIVSLIFGIQCVHTFRVIKKAQKPTPIATLILGINVIAEVVYIAIFAVIMYIMYYVPTSGGGIFDFGDLYF